MFFDLTKQETSKIKICFTDRKNRTQTVSFDGLFVTDWSDKTVIASSSLQRLFTLAFLVNGQDTGTYICSSIPDMLCFVVSSLLARGLYVHHISGNVYGYEKVRQLQHIIYAFM